MTFCTICGRASLDNMEYCRYHQEALNNLRSSYEEWREASGVSWKEYIERLCEIDETGQWVHEVADQIRSEDGPSTMT